MTPPHLLRVTEGPERFAPLVAAVQALDLRVGWLDLAPPPPVPGDLETAAGLGALRAVAVGGGRAVVVKPLRGEPVLGDLLREHFRGCVLVLVRGGIAAPLLQADGERWSVAVTGEAARAFTSADLAEALRSPRPPWAPPLPPRPPRPKRVKKTKQEKKRERIERRKKKPRE
ncbi:MAG TPA: hypothetical protein VKM72_00225 [Thermoanaerobaculia bacterium]|nr:hypothetical protein [Thermoanaerobaculia bacterium]